VDPVENLVQVVGSARDVVLLKGVLIAYGRTTVRAGTFAGVAYMMCSEWDRVIDEGPSYVGDATLAPDPTSPDATGP